MTTVISRVYADKETADGIVSALRDEGHPASNIDVFHAGEDGLQERMEAARVDADSAAVFSQIAGERTQRLLSCALPLPRLGQRATPWK